MRLIFDALLFNTNRDVRSREHWPHNYHRPLAVWTVAPSCWKQTFFSNFSDISSRHNAHSKGTIIVRVMFPGPLISIRVGTCKRELHKSVASIHKKRFGVTLQILYIMPIMLFHYVIFFVDQQNYYIICLKKNYAAPCITYWKGTVGGRLGAEFPVLANLPLSHLLVNLELPFGDDNFE